MLVEAAELPTTAFAGAVMAEAMAVLAAEETEVCISMEGLLPQEHLIRAAAEAAQESQAHRLAQPEAPE